MVLLLYYTICFKSKYSYALTLLLVFRQLRNKFAIAYRFSYYLFLKFKTISRHKINRPPNVRFLILTFGGQFTIHKIAVKVSTFSCKIRILNADVIFKPKSSNNPSSYYFKLYPSALSYLLLPFCAPLFLSIYTAHFILSIL